MINNFYVWDGHNLKIDLQIQTKAAKDAIIGEHNNRLKIAITAAPEAGKANTQLIKFLAKYFGVKQTQVKIFKGHTNKYKSVLVIEPQNNLTRFAKTI